MQAIERKYALDVTGVGPQQQATHSYTLPSTRLLTHSTLPLSDFGQDDFLASREFFFSSELAVGAETKSVLTPPSIRQQAKSQRWTSVPVHGQRYAHAAVEGVKKPLEPHSCIHLCEE